MIRGILSELWRIRRFLNWTKKTFCNLLEAGNIFGLMKCRWHCLSLRNFPFHPAQRMWSETLFLAHRFWSSVPCERPDFSRMDFDHLWENSKVPLQMLTFCGSCGKEGKSQPASESGDPSPFFSFFLGFRLLWWCSKYSAVFTISIFEQGRVDPACQR